MDEINIKNNPLFVQVLETCEIVGLIENDQEFVTIYSVFLNKLYASWCDQEFVRTHSWDLFFKYYNKPIPLVSLYDISHLFHKDR